MAIITKPLSPAEIQRAKAKDKDYSLSDGYGLFLSVRKSGAKIWRFQYTKPFSKKRTWFSLGNYPALSLAEARKLREEYRELLAKNIDPQEKNSQESDERLQQYNFVTVTQEWFALRFNEVERGELKQVTYDDIVERVNFHLVPMFQHLNIDEITAPIAKSRLQRLAQEGKIDTLQRVIGYLNRIMTYAVNSGMITYNPVRDLSEVFSKPIVENNPTIPATELPELFQRLQNSSITIETRCAIELTLLTAMRIGTITKMEWSEIDFEDALWNIPKTKMKGRIGKIQDFILPLSTQALQVLATMKKISGHRRYVFPGVRNPNESMARDTPNKALSRIGYQNILTAHGIRSIFSTTMNEAEFNSEIIEVCLAHFEYSSTRGTYNKAKYLSQRIEYMQWWGDFVGNLVPKSSTAFLQK